LIDKKAIFVKMKEEHLATNQGVSVSDDQNSLTGAITKDYTV
jgi:hypothetical protein